MLFSLSSVPRPKVCACLLIALTAILRSRWRLGGARPFNFEDPRNTAIARRSVRCDEDHRPLEAVHSTVTFQIHRPGTWVVLARFVRGRDPPIVRNMLR